MKGRRRRKQNKIAAIGMATIIVGFLLMVVPVIIWSQKANVLLWDYIVPILAGAMLTYSGLAIMRTVNVWWWNN